MKIALGKDIDSYIKKRKNTSARRSNFPNLSITPTSEVEIISKQRHILMEYFDRFNSYIYSFAPSLECSAKYSATYSAKKDPKCTVYYTVQ